MPEPGGRAEVRDPTFDELIVRLRPVGLADVEPVSLLGRFDRKFLLDEAGLAGLVGALGTSWTVLEVADRRETTCSSVYFDTPDLFTYRAHVQGRRNRFKVRTRHYGDPTATMLEVKLKGLRGRTVKHRRSHPGPDPTVLDDTSLASVASTISDAYGVELPADLSAVVATRFRRTTLVDLAAGIRVTIDRGLRVSEVRSAAEVVFGEGLAIVETKSLTLRPSVERLLVAQGARPERLSKYCMGVVALDPRMAGNPWRPQLRRLLADGERPAAGSESVVRVVP